MAQIPTAEYGSFARAIYAQYVAERTKQEERNRVTSEACKKAWIARRAAVIERKERRDAWRAGVARIIAEVRRREAARAMPEPPYYSSDNPLDGARLWA
jgi:hypothetical protein